MLSTKIVMLLSTENFNLCSSASFCNTSFTKGRGTIRNMMGKAKGDQEVRK